MDSDYEDNELAPESIVANVVASASVDDEPELPDVEPFMQAWHAQDRDGDAATGGHGGRITAWARHACGANGFGS